MAAYTGAATVQQNLTLFVSDSIHFPDHHANHDNNKQMKLFCVLTLITRCRKLSEFRVANTLIGCQTRPKPDERERAF